MSLGGGPEQLVVPHSFDALYGRGVRRGVCLGGGGTWFVAWQVGYLQALLEHHIRIERADRFVGTSAGSIVAATVAHRHLHRIYLETRMISKVPKLIGALFSFAHDRPSQQRALNLYIDAVDADPGTVARIGHAALAAQTSSPDDMPRRLFALLGSSWHSDQLSMTCVDTFTGERCVLTRTAGVATNRAAAASCAVPGIFAPQPILGRRCMDGGVSGSATHLDLLAGAEKALVLSFFCDAELEQSMLTMVPGGLGRELEQLRSSGTEVFFRAPGEHPWQPDEMMDPARIPEAMDQGRDQAGADAAALADFWA